MNYICKKQSRDEERWRRLCASFLPFAEKGSIWRYSRKANDDTPTQGWKLHISATAPNACRVFEAVAPYLTGRGVQFKAPATLDDLLVLNRGIQENYSQVGKFITIYPDNDRSANELALRLDELTSGYPCPAIPFDERYRENSCVFYRYGSFQRNDAADENGVVRSMIRGSDHDTLVPDDRFQAVPDWIDDPFKASRQIHDEPPRSDFNTPLNTRYAVIKALTQRGKGGVYQAVDLGSPTPRLVVIKEGRKYGELDWHGLDGYRLAKNERRALKAISGAGVNAPRVYSSFAIDGRFYLVMEWVEGKSLHVLLKTRRRRLSFNALVSIAIKIAEMLETIHSAGWVWNDCKPGNIISAPGGFRPVDFEGALRFGEPDKFDWKTKEFSVPNSPESKADRSSDLYAFGTVIYYLVTGKFFDPESSFRTSRLRRGVPQKLEKIIDELLRCGDAGHTKKTAAAFRTELQELI